MSGPLPSWLAPLTIPASWVYGAAVRRRNARFDRGVGVQSIDRPVISVGNISTGGTGKTPFVIWLSNWTTSRGIRPAIAMRGYGSTAGRRSDEQLEYADRLPDIPVVVDPDRVKALRALLPTNDVDCVILDDGFQHRFLKRDLDLVLVDETSGMFDDRLLPAGHLREPLENLRRADAVIVTRATEFDPELSACIADCHGKPPVAWTRHAWRALTLFAGESSENVSVDWLRGRRIVTMLGVGNPAAVLRQVDQAGATIAADVPARDHEQFSTDKVEHVRALSENADALLVTWKDWVKLREANRPAWRTRIVVPQMEIEVFAGLAELDALLSRVTSREGAATAGKPAR